MGAGPGDPELLTIKAHNLLKSAEVIIYTGSLVPSAIVQDLKANIYNSASMTLEEVMEIMIMSYEKGQKLVRLHTGDPSLYSSIAEQIAILKDKNIPFKVIPGVTSGLAAACRIGCELTIPNISQSVIITRISGRTPVPQKESLEALSKIQSSLILYLSVGHIERVVKALLKGYPENTPVAVVEKATWPDEQIIWGTLSDIALKVKEAGIRKTAIIIVGQALKGVTKPELHRSKLYSKYFSHEYRQALSKDKNVLKRFIQPTHQKDREKLIVFLGKNGEKIAQKLASYKKLQDAKIISFSKLKKEELLSKKWEQLSTIVFIGAVAIAVRTIAPHLKDKLSDPAVITIDECLQNVICILSGHLGGGNSLANGLAEFLKTRAVITTKSDLLDLPSIDIWLKKQELVPTDIEKLKDIQATFADARKINVFVHNLIKIKALPKGFRLIDTTFDGDLIISPFLDQHSKKLIAVPRCMSLGVGCHKGIQSTLLLKRAFNFLRENNISYFSIKRVCTIDKKANEQAIKDLSSELMAELICFSAKELNGVKGPAGSNVVKNAVGARAVSEPASILGAGKGGKLLIKKTRYPECTFAISISLFEIDNKL